MAKTAKSKPAPPAAGQPFPIGGIGAGAPAGKARTARTPVRKGKPGAAERRIQALEQELAGTKASLQAIIEQREDIAARKGVYDFAASLIEGLPFPLAALDRQLRIRQANAAFRQTFAGGQQVLGRPLAGLVQTAGAGADVARLLQRAAAGETALRQELRLQLPGGAGAVDMLLNAYRIAPNHEADAEAPVLMVNMTDITPIKQAEHAAAQLHEKETLIKEIHHRVKNNLQVISSLLALQAHDIDDPKWQRRLRDSQERVRSMALIHEKLYQSRNLERIDMRDYVQSLAGSLAHLYGVAAGTVTVAIEVDDVHLDIDTAIPAGLILNELISNVYKYAFPDQRRGHLSIGLAGDGAGQLLMTVADDGVGLPEGTDIDKADSLGVLIVRSLCEQLGGTLRYEGDGGAKFSVRFPRQIEKRAG